ncbi:LpxL/LpxP family Kdo(2)-lipid IV(A) lauroyl/palmitoleoyl acyltransferase [Solimonas marina]|uniref:Lipid A biosynthesis acyltransferase n=1 Tax=Solimonas marina TaxID=2714601 RepID=A0A969W7K6_9GAMM|nr:LpxL/LpxP family Kdo(2)-lipid IV(A) lauroyl/palmitoleoyl acyltransferase [Solimonas marina]NKF21040.1 LpxL/LpxP family Kdo(2)-lipid IV(A) lauroyl/palmitoleoyl acyltransferase [Solimonas marina]
MAAPRLEARHFSPRYWLTWLGIAAGWTLSWLPLWLLRGIGAGLGALAGQLLRSRRRVVRINLELCFPELDARARTRRVNAHFRALGAGVFETAVAWFAPDWRLRRRCEVVGLEHLDAAQQGGHGILLLTGHYTTLEIGARCICLAQRPFHAMYRPYNNAVLDYFMHRWREGRSGLPALPRDDLRGLVRALRAGHAIWYAPDQTLDKRISVFAPFFGVPVGTITATARLAQMGRAKVVPYYPQRIGGRYRVTFGPALENFPSGDELADAARINSVLEAGIREVPAEYFWVHRRFKRVPPGTPNPYRK